MKDKKKVLMIIPAAGFGQRVGSPPAKELMIRPQDGKSMISWCLDMAEQRDWPALVISRKDKHPLNDYIKKEMTLRSNQIELLTIFASEDWQDTILQSRQHWKEQNIVILPDTDFSPLEALDEIRNSLQNTSISFAIHKVPDPDKWGIIRPQAQNWRRSVLVEVCEKPKIKVPAGLAWGLLGFRRDQGVLLLESLLQSQKEGKFIKLPQKVSLIELAHFHDWTRPV